VIDFLTGTVFAIKGEIQRVGDKIFLCTPAKFEIEGSISPTF
jgi:cell division inhibitor SepF